MSLFNFFKTPDINQGVKEYTSTPGAILLDVRTPQEYREIHIPDSRNIPLQFLQEITNVIHNKNTPIFVYCHSGSRSSQAVKQLEKIGYTNVKNIGGIAFWARKEKA